MFPNVRITEKALDAFDQEPFSILSQHDGNTPRDKIAFRASAIFLPRGLGRFSREVIISQRPGDAYISGTITAAAATIKASFSCEKIFFSSLFSSFSFFFVFVFKYRTHDNGQYSGE